MSEFSTTAYPIESSYPTAEVDLINRVIHQDYDIDDEEDYVVATASAPVPVPEDVAIIIRTIQQNLTEYGNNVKKYKSMKSFRTTPTYMKALYNDIQELQETVIRDVQDLSAPDKILFLCQIIPKLLHQAFQNNMFRLSLFTPLNILNGTF